MFVVKLSVILCVIVSVCHGDGLSHTDSHSLFTRYDHNHDRCLDRQEFSKIFMDMDTWPEDGQISRTEFMAGWKVDHLHSPDAVPFFFELVDHAPRDDEITLHETAELYNNVFDSNNSNCVISSRFDYVWSALFVKTSD